MTEDWSDDDDIKVLENPEVTFPRRFYLHSLVFNLLWKNMEMSKDSGKTQHGRTYTLG